MKGDSDTLVSAAIAGQHQLPHIQILALPIRMAYILMLTSIHHSGLTIVGTVFPSAADVLCTNISYILTDFRRPFLQNYVIMILETLERQSTAMSAKERINLSRIARESA